MEDTMKDFNELKVSGKHLKLRIAAFVLALVVAIGAIGFGVSRIGAKEPGFYRVEANGDEEMVLYGRSVVFRYRFSGSSAAIRAQLQELRGVYGESLKRAARLLDPLERYHGVNNLAALNHSVGTPLELDTDLFAALSDAWERTRQGRGYSVFAGPWYAEWNSILILGEPQPFDPLENETERERLEILRALYAAPGNFSLELDESAHTACLTVSDTAQATLAELELENRVLDLNLLRDAWLLRLISADLEAAGWSEGFLSTGSGVTAALSGLEGTVYQMNALRNGRPVSAALAPAGGGSAFSTLRCFAMPEREDQDADEVYGYYLYETPEGETVYRHPTLPVGGETPQRLCASCVLGSDPVEVCYENLLLWFSENPADTAASLPDAAAWVARGEERLVNENAQASAAGLEPDGNYGWSAAR